jgi:hypothetical protein
MRLLDAGASGLLMNVLETQQDDTEVIRRTAVAVLGMSIRNRLAQNMFTDAGAARIVVGLLNRHR